MEGKIVPELTRIFHWKPKLISRHGISSRYFMPSTANNLYRAVSTSHDGAKKQKFETSSPLIAPKTVDLNNVSSYAPAPGSGEAINVDKKRKLPTKVADDAGVYRISPDPAQTVTASFHQKSSRRGLSKYRGAQCTSMALAAVLTSTSMPVNAWRTSDLDALLRYGDRLHQDLISRVDRKSTDPRLALHEIPTSKDFTYTVPIPSQEDKWFAEDYPNTQHLTLSKCAEFYGQVYPAKHSNPMDCADLGDTAMEQALDNVLYKNFDGAVLTVGNVSGAVIKDSMGRIRYFDSHSNNKIGRMTLEGTAVLLTFDTVHEFARYIRKRESNAHCRYEMIGIRVDDV